MTTRIVLFLLINFAALGIGGYFTGPGVASDWFQNFNQAPWNPPGWVFGTAWTFIMICFSFFMASLWGAPENKTAITSLFVVQWLLNVGWNVVFFHFRSTEIGLVVISLLTIVVAIFLFAYTKELKAKALLVLPYFIWLLIATSLHTYIVLNN